MLFLNHITRSVTSIDVKAQGAMCIVGGGGGGGGLLYLVVHHTCGGEGGWRGEIGGMSKDDSSFIHKWIGNNVASIEACDDKWGGFDSSPKAWYD